MRCYQARRLLSACLDGEVDPRRRAPLESHLASCEACAAELAEMSAQWDALAEAGQTPALPPDLWPRVLAELAETERLPWHQRYRTRFLQAACVSAFIVIGFIGGVLLPEGQPVAEGVPEIVPMGERMMVAEAFDAAAFGLSEREEGLLGCVPR